MKTAERAARCPFKEDVSCRSGSLPPFFLSNGERAVRIMRTERREKKNGRTSLEDFPTAQGIHAFSSPRFIHPTVQNYVIPYPEFFMQFLFHRCRRSLSEEGKKLFGSLFYYSRNTLNGTISVLTCYSFIRGFGIGGN